MDLKAFNKKRSSLRSSITNIIKNVDTFIEDKNFTELEDHFELLNSKEIEIRELDDKIQNLIKDEDAKFELDIKTSMEYIDKIIITKSKIKRYFKNVESQNFSKNISNDSHSEIGSKKEKEFESNVKLPKMSILKFFGDFNEWSNFWNSFKITIHDNTTLSKIEKFNYLKSYLGGNAASSIEGFSISESNYDAAIEILTNRFGQKHLIINTHMSNLLNLNPVQSSNDIIKLRKLYDTINVQIRSLMSLDVKPESYSNMLIPVLMKIIPNDIALEFHRNNTDNFDLDNFLKFLRNEIESREKISCLSLSHKSKPQLPESKNTHYKNDSKYTWNSNVKKKEFNKYSKQKPSVTTHEFIATTLPNRKCIFCSDERHSSEKCEVLTVNEKRDILKQSNRCFLCTSLKHKIAFCPYRKTKACGICGGLHFQGICFKSNTAVKNSEADKREVSSISKIETQAEPLSEKIVSVVSHVNNVILLQTCTIKIKTGKEKMFARLLLDTGSMKSFVTRELANKLNLEVIRKEKLTVFTFGNTTPFQKNYDVVKLSLEHRSSSDSRIEVELLVTDQISGSNVPTPRLEEIRQIRQLKNLILADSPDSEESIGILIGVDYYYDIVMGHIKRLNKNLVAVETIFGWCLQGRESQNDVSLSFNVIVGEDIISKQITKFWSLENSGLISEKENLDSIENEALKHFESNITYENSRYKVRLPWKHETTDLNDNWEIAEQRFDRLRKRFKRNPDLFFEYQNVIQDYLNQNIIEQVTDIQGEGNITFYLPHREVIREDRTTSKLRIVFDASSHPPGSISLNDCLHVGPNLYPEIFDILLRFRYNPIAFTADIRQAFLQILIDERDRDVTRFLFSEFPSDETIPPKIYRFTRVLFGMNCSPFLLAATIRYHLKKYREVYPTTVEILDDNIYVDDAIGSQPTVRETLTTTLESIKIFKEASMHLHKFRTNSKELHELWKEEGIVSDEGPETFDKENPPFKVLGMAWDNSNDLLYFDVRSLLSFLSKPIETKRFILQVLGRIFDPLGILGPFTVRIKCLIQKIWSSRIDWDEPLPEDLTSQWRSWCEEIPQMAEFSIPRHYFFKFSNFDVQNIELHCFSDASTKAYGTVAYLRFTTNNNEIKTAFVASKNRVAPLKALTLPRLELMGALLSAKLSNNILKSIKLNVPCFFWTDSTIVYFWIRKQPETFKPFVKNRVEEIQKLTSPQNWHYCPGVDNPADLVSRGSKISKLTNEPVWTQGPRWLQLSSNLWPKLDLTDTIDEAKLEYRKKSTNVHQLECTTENIDDLLDLSKFSDLEKLLRVTAWIKRFVSKLRKCNSAEGALKTEELLEAENFWFRSEQKTFFAEEYKSLKEGKPIDKNSPLYSFVPYIDEKEIMRLGGRLEFSDLTLDNKHPIILPKNSRLTYLVVRKQHEKIMHGGTAATLAKVRSRFWVPKGRQLVKKTIKNCLICQKYSAKPADQMTAPLPKDRILESSPFAVCGVDFAGPVYVKNSKDTQKSYITLFTCAVTRAIHLELVSNMSTESFLLAFRRFLSRRGNCKIIYSDNAKTFKKAKKEVENFSRILEDDVFKNFIAKERTQWKFIIERAAWWGGFYERLVRSVKNCLRKIVGKALLNFEEMSTLLVEVETVLNSRPLSYVYNENDEPQPLTPMHFLNFGQADPKYPLTFAEIISCKTTRKTLLKRKRYQELLLKQLWIKWKQQYLLELKTAHSLKNPDFSSELKLNDVVLVQGDNKNKLLWKLGKIIKAIPGRDGKIRSYELKTGNGTLKRTAQHLYPLELLNS